MLTIGIAGAGLRGQMFARALADVPGVAVVGFAEPSERTAKAATEATGISVHPDHRALLSATSPDAVIVATPDFAHREIAVDVADAGVHLLIEKPLATTVEDAWAIADAVHAGGARCLVGFENRWNPHARRAYDAVASGALGTPITSTATLSNSYYVPTQMLAWAAKSSPAWFLMPHTLDLLMWLNDSEVATVSAVSTRGVLAGRGVDTDDVMHALITFRNGATANLSSTWVLPDAGEGIVDFRFGYIGTQGSISADLSHQGLSVVTDRTRSEWPLSGTIGRTQVGPAIWMVEHFARALQDGGDLGPGVDHGLAVTRAICAMELAARTGRAVAVEEVQPGLG